jgi:SAM-dependent methyltransferase
MADALLEQWDRDAAAPFEGWDFSYLNGRMAEPEPPWSYLDLARTAVADARDILDVATGGGEVFASLAPFPGRATAVEGYVPNIAVARRRLEPLGVKVFQSHSGAGLPFEEEEAFDLVLSRHGGFEAGEIRRVLKPGGTFLTQQVGGDNLADLAATFGARLTHADNTLARVCDDFTALGCDIRRSEEWHGPVTFHDVGALVYFLKAIPWVVEDFEVARFHDVLKSLHREVQSGRPLRFTYSRFLVQAVKAEG